MQEMSVTTRWALKSSYDRRLAALATGGTQHHVAAASLPGRRKDSCWTSVKDHEAPFVPNFHIKGHCPCRMWPPMIPTRIAAPAHTLPGCVGIPVPRGT